MANGRLLFVVTEVGAARFIEPLWKRWLERPPHFEWRVVAADRAADHLRKTGLAEALPGFTAANTTDVELAGLGEWIPTAVAASAGDHYDIELAAVRLARRLGAPSAQFIDTWYNYRRRFDHAGGLTFPDTILVIDKVALGEAAAEGLPRDALEVVGQPAWEHVASLQPAPKQHVLFLGAPTHRDYGMSLGYDEASAWQVVLEAAARHPDKIRRLMYGVHPAQGTIDADAVAPAILTHDSVAALQQCGTVLGMFSSPMIDAYLGGRTVVSVQPNLRGQDRSPLSRHGRIARVGDSEALVAAIERPPSASGSLMATLRGSTDRLDAWLCNFVGIARNAQPGKAGNDARMGTAVDE